MPSQMLELFLQFPLNPLSDLEYISLRLSFTLFLLMSYYYFYYYYYLESGDTSPLSRWPHKLRATITLPSTSSDPSSKYGTSPILFFLFASLLHSLLFYC